VTPPVGAPGEATTLRAELLPEDLADDLAAETIAGAGAGSAGAFFPDELLAELLAERPAEGLAAEIIVGAGAGWAVAFFPDELLAAEGTAAGGPGSAGRSTARGEAGDGLVPPCAILSPPPKDERRKVVGLALMVEHLGMWRAAGTGAKLRLQWGQDTRAVSASSSGGGGAATEG
jgi:hypothetical protein